MLYTAGRDKEEAGATRQQRWFCGFALPFDCEASPQRHTRPKFSPFFPLSQKSKEKRKGREDAILRSSVYTGIAKRFLDASFKCKKKTHAHLSHWLRYLIIEHRERTYTPGQFPYYKGLVCLASYTLSSNCTKGKRKKGYF